MRAPRQASCFSFTQPPVFTTSIATPLDHLSETIQRGGRHLDVCNATRRHPQAAISTPTCQQLHSQRGTRPTPNRPAHSPQHTPSTCAQDHHPATHCSRSRHSTTNSPRLSEESAATLQPPLAAGMCNKACAMRSPQPRTAPTHTDHTNLQVIPTRDNFDSTQSPHRHVCFIMQGTGTHSALHATATVGVQTTVMQSEKKHRLRPFNQGTTPKPLTAARCRGRRHRAQHQQHGLNQVCTWQHVNRNSKKQASHSAPAEQEGRAGNRCA